MANQRRAVPLTDLAETWGISKAGARAYVLRNEGTFVKLADPEKGGQKVLCLEPAEADRLIQLRAGNALY